MIEEIKKKYLESFGIEPLLVRAPGRINLISEHIDLANEHEEIFGSR